MKRRSSESRGFTLIEVLVTMLLLALVLPLVMNGITSASSAASDARRRNEAAGLAEEKLDEIIATQAWVNQPSLSGDFTMNGANNWPDYRWNAVIQPWTQPTASGGLQINSPTNAVNMYQIDLRVEWKARNRDQSITLSTLAYQRPTAP
jgi:prepilin-type N-terminal cleavage/methylation domain-containing protein